jgi:hypothetical protein
MIMNQDKAQSHWTLSICFNVLNFMIDKSTPLFNFGEQVLTRNALIWMSIFDPTIWINPIGSRMFKNK